MTGRYGFYFDSRSCTGCKACQVACKDKNQLDSGLLWRRVIEVSGGEWIQRGDAWLNTTFAYFLSLACMHCERPICLEVCPSKAITQREDGIVLINRNRCIGCRYCEWACPYRAPQFDYSKGVMTKCDLCCDYLDQGISPACVSACQMRVLEFGDISELRAKHGDLEDIFPLPAASFTQPAVVFTPHNNSVRAMTDAAKIGNEEEI